MKLIDSELERIKNIRQIEEATIKEKENLQNILKLKDTKIQEM